MKGKILGYDRDNNLEFICIEQRAHIVIQDSPGDQTGQTNLKLLNVRPCDGSCVRESEIPIEFTEVVRHFLKTGVTYYFADQEYYILAIKQNYK